MSKPHIWRVTPQKFCGGPSYYFIDEPQANALRDLARRAKAMARCGKAWRVVVRRDEARQG